MSKPDTEQNKTVLKALKSLVGVSDSDEIPDRPDEIDEATFRAELSIEYPLIQESEQEAEEFLIGVLEHDGEEIQIHVDQFERSDNEPE